MYSNYKEVTKMVIWSLFDDANSCTKQVNNNIISIGVNNADFIIDLSGDISPLEKLPKPDIILASPPCESWSTASSIKGKKGNASWARNKGDEFVVQHYDTINLDLAFKKTQNRINGELCTINTLRIIEKYKPKMWYIENPKTSMIWEYIQQLGFHGVNNFTYYNNYNIDGPKKPTNFLSNIDLKLSNENIKGVISLQDISNYNDRSNIPLELIKHILKEK